MKMRTIMLLLFLFFPIQLPLSAAGFDNSHLIADAAAGDPEAQYTLAHLYLKGQGGVEKNATAGIGLLEQAAAGAHKDAALDLALLYMNGMQVKKDNVKALVWFRKAADLGQVDSQYYLGLAYKSIDADEALRWLRMAEKNGHDAAAAELKMICGEAPDLCR